jgi:hypothetical protein
VNVVTLVLTLGNITLLVLLAVFITARCRKKTEADQRAGELLRALLTPVQYRQLRRQGHIDLKSPSDPARVYRVPQHPGRVQVRVDGKLKEWLCLQSYEWVPDADLVVIHKLMIEADEETYLRKANHIEAITLWPNFRDPWERSLWKRW